MENGTPRTKSYVVDKEGNKLEDRKNEILITLKNANTKEFSDISDMEIYKEIVAMDVGKVKKAIFCFVEFKRRRS